MKIFLLSTILLLFINESLFSQSGQLTTQTIAETDRSYLLYVPAAYDGETDWPLILNFHALTGNGKSQSDISRMNSVADTAHFIVAYPNGEAVGTYESGWNIPGTGLSGTQNDVAFTEDILAAITAEYSIDTARIHSTGWSMGGEMSFYLACIMPEKIASVASVSGLMLAHTRNNCETERPFSILQIYGTADDVDPYNYEAALFWSGHNQCSADSVVTELPDKNKSDNSTVTKIEYLNCNGDTEVQHYRVNGGGHGWPGSWSMGTLNKDINAHEVVWDFFKNNPHPDYATTVSTESGSLIPHIFQLNQNYPNPFNPSTNISFYLAKDNFVSLEVFDMLGQKVATLLDGEPKSAGYHQLTFDASSLSSGLYVYRLSNLENISGNLIQSKKMMLIK